MDSVSNSNVERYGKSLDQDFFKQCFSMCSTLIIMNKYDLINEKNCRRRSLVYSYLYGIVVARCD